MLPGASPLERIGLLRTCVASGVLCAVGCFLCLLDFAPVDYRFVIDNFERRDLDEVAFLLISLRNTYII